MGVVGVGQDIVDDVVPLMVVLDHPVDGAPVGEASQVAVVDEEIDLQLAGEMGVVVGGLLGVVTVDGIELEAAFTAPVDGLIQQWSFSYGPEDQAMAILSEHLQGVDGEGDLLANGGVFMGKDCTVEIYCD